MEVDHIIPRSEGGPDELSNYQALCWKCNANKGDRDRTDFRYFREQYQHRESDCVFCDMPPTQIVDENALAVAVHDRYPVTPLHILVMPKRHAVTYFDLYAPERRAIELLLDAQRTSIASRDHTVEGFNIGMNAGDVAGQTVMHCHVHLIPRRRGDSSTPRGGVRQVIPGKGDY